MVLFRTRFCLSSTQAYDARIVGIFRCTRGSKFGCCLGFRVEGLGFRVYVLSLRGMIHRWWHMYHRLFSPRSAGFVYSRVSGCFVLNVVITGGGFLKLNHKPLKP